MRGPLPKWLGLLAVFAAAFALGDAAAQPAFAPPPAGRVIVYSGADLIDGTGGPIRRDMAVVVDGETIRQVLPSRAFRLSAWRGARIVDLKGRYILPGLIDSHEHLATPPDRKLALAMMRRDLYGGITAVRDMADDLREVRVLARKARTGEIAGPDIYYAALMAGPSFFDDPRTHAAAQGVTAGKVPWMQAIDAGTDIGHAVTMARATGATAIKIYANLPANLVRRITAEAHRQGMLVWAHAMVFPATPAEVIGAGVDSVSHVCYLAFQASDRRPASYQDRFPVDYAKFEGGDNEVMAGLFREMRRRGIILDATDRVYEAAERRAAAAPGGKPFHCSADLAERLTNQAWRAGVAISAGTDGFADRASLYPSLHEELDLLVRKAGMPPGDAIRSATLIGARAIGQERSTGTIAPGKLANLVVLARDPLEDIANLRSIVFTVKRGRRFDRADYRPVARREMPGEE
jgi:imidazolonepropionase-like amidohydrolase